MARSTILVSSSMRPSEPASLGVASARIEHGDTPLRSLPAPRATVPRGAHPPRSVQTSSWAQWALLRASEGSKSLRLANEFLSPYPHGLTRRAGVYPEHDAKFDGQDLSGERGRGVVFCFNANDRKSFAALWAAFAGRASTPRQIRFDAIDFRVLYWRRRRRGRHACRPSNSTSSCRETSGGIGRELAQTDSDGYIARRLEVW